VVAIFAERMLTGTPAVINGDGGQTRDYVYVGDVVRGITAALSQDTPAVVNIGTGVETDVNTIFQLLRREITSRRRDLPEITEQHGPAAPGEQQRSVIANDLARRLLNWRPEVDLNEGIRRTVDYFVEQLS
jgi:UDP-glucose 4-epimerase